MRSDTSATATQRSDYLSGTIGANENATKRPRTNEQLPPRGILQIAELPGSILGGSMATSRPKRLDRQVNFKATYPITAQEVVRFRELLMGSITDSVVDQRTLLAQMLGVDSVSVWRWETSKSLTQQVMLRRALVNIADELGVEIPATLRFGRKEPVPKSQG